MGQSSLNNASPNIIGNVEDMASPHHDLSQSYPSLKNPSKEEEMAKGAGPSEFKDITPNLMRPPRNKSKNRQTL